MANPINAKEEVQGESAGCPHNRVQVPYDVPVEVVVNTVACGHGMVARVVVIDESATRDKEGQHRCYDCDEELPYTHPNVRAAIKLAEDPRAEWPGWDIGW